MNPDEEELLASLAPEERHDLPSPEVAARRERAAGIVAGALEEAFGLATVRISPLGPAWSSDIDVHVVRPPAGDVLRGLGWLPVGFLLHRVGVRASGRWAVIDDGRVLTAVDIQQGPAPDPVESVLGRCRRRGEIRVREVLELRALARDGHRIPDEPLVRAIARAEAGLGGTVLERWADGPPIRPPVRLGARRRLHRPSWTKPRYVVAISGVDGSGKSTLCRSLAADLESAGVPTSIVWTRPGMALGWLDRLARVVKRLIRHGSEPVVAQTGAGERAAALPSRRGAVGWLWALLVTASFVRGARRGGRGGRVLIYDRHLLDALVTLDVVYAGVRLGVHRRLVRTLLPPADVTFYVDVPAETAIARKPDPVFGEGAIRRQLDRYAALLPTVPRVHRIDGTRPARDVSAQVIGLLLQAPRRGAARG